MRGEYADFLKAVIMVARMNGNDRFADQISGRDQAAVVQLACASE